MTIKVSDLARINTTVAADPNPTLSGDLDTNDNSIINSSGPVNINGLNYPETDGTDGQIIITDGSGNLTFSDIQISKVEIFDGETADVNGEYFIATNITVNLPDYTTLSDGDSITFTKAIDASEPVIQAFTSQEINSDLKIDTSIIFDVTDEIVLVYNGMRWQLQYSGTVTTPEIPIDLNDLPDVSFTLPVGVSEVIAYNGSYWTNTVPSVTEEQISDLDKYTKAEANMLLASKIGLGDNISLLSNDSGYLSEVSFDDLSDTVITTPNGIQVLLYNGTTWVNTDLTEVQSYRDDTANDKDLDLGTGIIRADQAIVGGVTYPDSDGLANQTLVTDGLGIVTWQDQSGGSGGGGGATSLEELTDVTTTDPADGQFLRYSNNNWINDNVNDIIARVVEFKISDVRFFGELGEPVNQGWTYDGDISKLLLVDEIINGEERQVVKFNDNSTGIIRVEINMTSLDWIDIQSFGATYSGTSRLDSVNGVNGFFAGIGATGADNPLDGSARRYGITFANSGGYLKITDADDSSSVIVFDGTNDNMTIAFDDWFEYVLDIPPGLGNATVIINGIITSLTIPFRINTGGILTGIILSSGSSTSGNRITYHENYGVTIFKEGNTKLMDASDFATSVTKIIIPPGPNDYTLIFPTDIPDRLVGSTIEFTGRNTGGNIILLNENPDNAKVLINGKNEFTAVVEQEFSTIATNTLDNGNVYTVTFDPSLIKQIEVDDISNVTVTDPRLNDRLRFDGSNWVNSPAVNQTAAVTNDVAVYTSDTVTTSEGTFFLVRLGSTGFSASTTISATSGASGSPEPATSDFLGQIYTEDATFIAGQYSGIFNTSFSGSSSGTSQITLEIYLADSEGSVIDAETGSDTGSLGVITLLTMQSDTFTDNLNARDITINDLVNVGATVPAGHRLRHRLLAEKVGSTTPRTFTFSFGDDLESRLLIANLVNLTELGDVTITEPAENDGLIYVGNKWVNQQLDLSTASSAYKPVEFSDGLVIQGDEVLVQLVPGQNFAIEADDIIVQLPDITLMLDGESVTIVRYPNVQDIDIQSFTSDQFIQASDTFVTSSNLQNVARVQMINRSGVWIPLITGYSTNNIATSENYQLSRVIGTDLNVGNRYYFPTDITVSLQSYASSNVRVGRSITVLAGNSANVTILPALTEQFSFDNGATTGEAMTIPSSSEVRFVFDGTNWSVHTFRGVSNPPAFELKTVGFTGSDGLPDVQGWTLDQGTVATTSLVQDADVFGQSKQVLFIDDMLSGSDFTRTSYELTKTDWENIVTYGHTVSGVAKLASANEGFTISVSADISTNPQFAGGGSYSVRVNESSSRVRFEDETDGAFEIKLDGSNGNPNVLFDEWFTYKIVIPANLGIAKLFVNDIETTFSLFFRPEDESQISAVSLTTGMTTSGERQSYHDSFETTFFGGVIEEKIQSLSYQNLADVRALSFRDRTSAHFSEQFDKFVVEHKDIVDSGNSRPASANTGQQFFDTILGKPIWYNGTDWVDSSGNIV